MDQIEEREGLLLARLLVERQVDAAHRWRYEWIILTNLGLLALVFIDVAVQPGIDILTVLGAVAVTASGVWLTRAETKAVFRLLDLYDYLGGRSTLWPRPWWSGRWRSKDDL
jgi:hypothetical protein